MKRVGRGDLSVSTDHILRAIEDITQQLAIAAIVVATTPIVLGATLVARMIQHYFRKFG